MKQKHVFIFLFLLCLFHFKAQQVLNWEFYHPVTKEWIPLGVKGTVQEVLRDRKLLPDPFYGENEKEYQWIEDYSWTFRAKLFLSETLFNAKSVDIHFPCIDTYGSVFVNDSLLFTSSNYFRPYVFDIHNLLICGYNEIKVVITPPTLYHQKQYQSSEFNFPAPNDVAKIKTAPLTRKPQYQFGWDWALRMNTIGIPEEVFIEIPKRNEIKRAHVKTISIGEIAKIEYQIETKESIDNWHVHSRLLKTDFQLEKNGSSSFQTSLNKPKLWWPIGFGEPNMYCDTLDLIDKNGLVVDTFLLHFGIRSVVLKQEKDEWGTSFSFIVNDIPIFLKGANFIPPTVFNRSTTDEEWNNWVDILVKNNFNAIRIWGGGDYADEAFLDACDQNGIMVWHDAMFACAMYPGDGAFLSNISDEFEFQIPRLVRHPSIIVINGNNEVDVAWKNWGFQAQYKLKEKDQNQIQEAYDEVFKNLLPTIISKYSNVPYTHTSPLSNWGKDEFYNHGTQHYWGVWHGADPMVDFATKIGRFNAEYGFQSFPEPATLLTFSDKEDFDLTSRVMKHHQKSYVGNGMIEKHANVLYGKSKNFEDFVYKSQLTQAYAVSSAVVGHRLDAPRCMGTLYWQLNDCWPAPTWSSIDYYGNWKALQYQIREDYRQVAILKKTYAKGIVQLFLKSDNPNHNGKPFNITIEVYSLQGKLISKTQKSLTANYMEDSMIGTYTTQNQFVKVKLENDYERSFLISHQKSFQSSKKNAPKVNVEISLQQIDTLHNTATVIVKNNAFVADFWLYSKVNGVHYDNNFISLLPGTHSFKISFDKIPRLEDFNFNYR